MKILIIGGAGFVGTNTVLKLVEERHEVIVVDNFYNSTPENIKRISEKTGCRIPHHKVDISNKEEISFIFRGYSKIDAVIFLAYDSSSTLSCYNSNITGLINVMSLCETYNVRNFIFSSTWEVYDNFQEEQKFKYALKIYNEDCTFNINSKPSVRTKQISESFLQNISESNKNINIIILRYFNIIGDNERCIVDGSKVGNLSTLFSQLATEPLNFPVMEINNNTRDYIHIDDVVDANLECLNYFIKMKNNIEIFNVGSGIGYTKLNLINKFEKVSGQRLNPNSFIFTSNGNKVIADISRIKNKTTWYPKRSIESCMYDSWIYEINRVNNKK